MPTRGSVGTTPVQTYVHAQREPSSSTPGMRLAWSVGGKGQGDASSGCTHVACFSREAGSEVGSTAYEQTYYFAISEDYVDC